LVTEARRVRASIFKIPLGLCGPKTDIFSLQGPHDVKMQEKWIFSMRSSWCIRCV